MELIAFEGIDGSGKGTQAELLRQKLVADGKEVVLMSFPGYTKTIGGHLVGRYLNGDFGDIAPELASLLYAVDRAELLSSIPDCTDVVIFDRYVYSNVAHQSARCTTAEQAAEFRNMILKLEFEVLHTPRPDYVVYLHINPELAMEHVKLKSKRAYTDKQLDLHEADFSHLLRTGDVYRNLCDSAIQLSERTRSEYTTWLGVNVAEGHVMRSKEEIAAEVYNRIFS